MFQRYTVRNSAEGKNNHCSSSTVDTTRSPKKTELPRYDATPALKSTWVFEFLFKDENKSQERK
jgi:hypothetical protein